MNNKELVFTAITDVFVNRDITAFDTYFSKNYIQHNPHLPNGTEVLKQFIPTLSITFSYEPGTVTENENIVMIHGRYKDWNGKNMIAVDIFRVENGKIAAHWDVMQEEITADKTANGNPMFPIN
ncbi:putative SnoaL-like aldol condensation-catalyzing enzyme [Chryseobacterium sp. H1D6B]|uniref:nuclear transport factor 2 family protein n=1 Tax=Chryseobacterium sp. H1D6B TaxID=2940588 RepID=UPI0015C99761|nr:nuclear transport factor 2 family protein [Chryseobacterium sp. H1D6B]MDH6252808.1 putative SnoaL-like aldol condensation-catalyzing enzyme [Chryseobacterium sp. H1D6B]